MIALLTRFVAELRETGIPVSVSEALDAAAALRVVDLADREALRAALGSTLVKSKGHQDAFDTAFDVFFGLAVGSGALGDAKPEAVDLAIASAGGSGGTGGEGDPDLLAMALLSALRDGDRERLRSISRIAVENLAGLEPGRPVGGTYARHRILTRLDLEGVRSRLIEDRAPFTDALAERLAREEVEIRLDEFRRLLDAEIRALLIADRGPEAVARTLRRPLIEDVDITTATREDLASMERAVHPLARKLAVRLARRRLGRTGRLDVRRTVRKSLSTGGALADPQFRPRRPSRPEIVLLCDISGSVATFARFTMQLVHSISSQFSRVRSFAFIDAIDEVTGFFGTGAGFADVLGRISSEARVVWIDGHSDYGHALGQFAEGFGDAVGPKSTVIITGDARTNYHDPNPAALGRVAESGRALFWLNPEPRRYWNTGDSVIGRYAPLCDGVYEVRTLRHLEHFVERAALPTLRAVPRRTAG